MTTAFRGAAVSVLCGLIAACSDAPADTDVIQSFAALTAPEAITLMDKRADAHDVRAAAVTILDGGVPFSHFIGGADERSPFQAASLSKAVAAAGILSLMAREGIDIDEDIRGRFVALDVRAIPGGDQPLTVRELLSHTAGATQGGYPGYRRGSALPTSAQVVTDPPSRLVSAVTLNGVKGVFDYSGGGYQIAQVLAEDISGQSFADLMAELIFVPLGMEHSTFAQPIDPNAIAPLRIIGADSGIRPSEGVFRSLKDDWHDYPEQAAAGLWTTSGDYARFVKAVIDAAQGEPSALSSSIGQAMLTPVAYPGWAKDGEAYGLGVLLRPDADGTIIGMSHSGLNAGYRSLFDAAIDRDMIVVSLTNAPGGAAFNAEVVEGLMQSRAAD